MGKSGLLIEDLRALCEQGDAILGLRILVEQGIELGEVVVGNVIGAGVILELFKIAGEDLCVVGGAALKLFDGCFASDVRARVDTACGWGA